MSDFGGQLAVFALPTIAIFSLHASAFQVGAISAIEYAIVPLFAMLAGVLIDRWRRRQTMIAANLFRMAAIGALPIALAFHALSFWLLIAIAGFAALASLFFDTAYQPYLAGLVGRGDYESANAAMTAGACVAKALANAACGPVVSCFGAGLALIANVATYACGTTALGAIERREPRRPASNSRIRDDFRDGVALLRSDSVLARLAVTTALYYFAGSLIDAILPLYAYRALHLSPLMFGLLLALANAGLLGARYIPRATRRFGPWPVLGCAIAAIGVGDALCLLPALPLIGLVAGRFIVAAAAPSYDVIAQSVATSRVSDAMLGRMNAAMRTLTNAAIPLGCLSGGALVTHSGFTVGICAGIACFALALTTSALIAHYAGKERTQCSLCPMENLSLPQAA